MKKPKLKDGYMEVPRYTLLEVVWMDAFGSAGWEEEDSDPKPPLVRSVGYLIRSTEDGLILAGGIPDAAKSKMMLAPSFIPHGMVQNVRKLK